MESNRQINKLLARQIKRKLGAKANISTDMWKLMYAVSDSYDHFERDRKLIDRAMECSSQELRESFQKLIIKNELERKNIALQQFVSIASHDLKAPLRTISSFTQLLEKELGNDLSENSKEFLNFIQSGVQGMNSLIENLLNYARGSQEDNKVEWVSIENTINLVQRNCLTLIAEKNAKVIVNSNMPKIMADPHRLIQLFQNLICNAIKFQRKDVPPIIYIRMIEKEGKYLFSIQDNGIGISPKNKEKVFDVFERVHSMQEYEGTGLGLSICKKIVNNLGGDIWLESEEGKGSTFYFNIPIQKKMIHNLEKTSDASQLTL